MKAPDLDARLAEKAPELPRRRDRPEPVVQHAHWTPSRARAASASAKRQPVGVAPDDVVLEVDPAARPGDDVEHGGVGVGAVDEEANAVAGNRAGRRRARLIALSSDCSAPIPVRVRRHGAAEAEHAARAAGGRRARRRCARRAARPAPRRPAVTSSRLTPRANALSLSFFFTLDDLEVGEAPGRPHQRAGHEEAAQLVHREERLRHRRVAGDAGVGRVAEDGAAARPRAVPRARMRTPSAGCSSVARVGVVGEAFVVEVVQQPDQAPAPPRPPRRARPWPAWPARRRTCAFGAASEAVYSCIRASARSREIGHGLSGSVWSESKPQEAGRRACVAPPRCLLPGRLRAPRTECRCRRSG